MVNKAKKVSQDYLVESRYEHAKRVVNILCKYEKPSDVEIVAAYLHDIFEDTYLSEEYILEEFGQEVVSLVKELTNPIDHCLDRSFEHMTKASKKAKRIKLCDRIDNMSKRIHSINEYKKKKILSYIEESKNLFEMLKNSDEELSNLYLETLGSLEEACRKNCFE
jgi:(p)ppGpp synthase/HD superfamily hydrolase